MRRNGHAESNLRTKAHGKAARHKGTLLQGLIVVSAHDERVIHNAVLIDQRPEPNHGVVDL